MSQIDAPTASVKDSLGPSVRCPVTGSARIVRVTDTLSYSPDADHYFQSNLTPSIIYDDAYMETYERYPTDNMSFLRAGYAYAELKRELPRFGVYKTENTSILDFGYGNGAFLKRMSAVGFATYGLDVHGVDYGIQDWQVGMDANPNVVTAFDSIEHVPSFDFFFSMQPQIFIISTPHRPVWFGRHHSLWKHYKPGEHLHYFSPRSLKLLFARHGYEEVATGTPEDIIRGKVEFEGISYDNILVSTFVRQVSEQ